MTKLLGTITAHLISIAGIIRFYFSLPAASQSELLWQIGTVAMVVINVAAIAWETVSHIQSAPKRFRLTQPGKIRRYMIRWLRSGGRSVIFTRDMTWVDETVREILLAKARNRELTICLEHPLPIATELQREGAQVISYGELGVVPRSRYTIVDFGKNGARVAVGGAVHNHHVIQEFRDGEHPFFAVSDDLAKILIAYHRQMHAAPPR